MCILLWSLLSSGRTDLRTVHSDLHGKRQWIWRLGRQSSYLGIQDPRPELALAVGKTFRSGGIVLSEAALGLRTHDRVTRSLRVLAGDSSRGGRDSDDVAEEQGIRWSG